MNSNDLDCKEFSAIMALNLNIDMNWMKTDFIIFSKVTFNY